MRLCSPNLRQATAAATCANTPLAAALGKSSSNSHIHGRLSFSHTLLNHRAKRAGWAVRVLPLTEENVERVLDEVRPSLMADGGNVALHEIDGLVVVLMLQGACGSCPSSTMTLKMGIETRLRDKIPEILEVEQIHDTETGLELNTENVEKVSQIPCHMLAYQSVFIVHATCLFSFWHRRWKPRACSDRWFCREGSNQWTCSQCDDSTCSCDTKTERENTNDPGCSADRLNMNSVAHQ